MLIVSIKIFFNTGREKKQREGEQEWLYLRRILHSFFYLYASFVFCMGGGYLIKKVWKFCISGRR